MHERLKPCPFCGKPPHRVETAVGCRYASCPVQPMVTMSSLDEAVEAWNTRGELLPEEPGTWKARLPDGRIVSGLTLPTSSDLARAMVEKREA